MFLLYPVLFCVGLLFAKTVNWIFRRRVCNRVLTGSLLMLPLFGYELHLVFVELGKMETVTSQDIASVVGYNLGIGIFVMLGAAVASIAELRQNAKLETEGDASLPTDR